MRLFCLWFLIPLGIFILGVLGTCLAEVLMARRGRSRLRTKIVGMLISMLTSAVLVGYILYLLNR